MGPLDYMVITVAHWGMTLEGFAKFVASFEGVQQAYNLDGGNSTQIILCGEKINARDFGKARDIADMIIFATLKAPEE